MFIISDQNSRSDTRSAVWIFENDSMEVRSNYKISEDDRIIQFKSSSNLTTKEKERKIIIYNSPPLRYDSCWIQHCTPLQPSAHSTNSFKTRVMEIGESVVANGNIGIQIGLAYKFDPNRVTPNEWKHSGIHYNCLNGGIYHRPINPIEFVERAKVNDVIEWTISCSNTDNARAIKSVALKINGEVKGEPVIIEEDEQLFPTLHIASSGAKVESGFHSMSYSKTVKGKLENMFP